MKVLMLGWELPPHNSGGLGVACYQLCESLSKKSIDIEFVLPYTAKHDVKFMNIRSAHPQGFEEVIKSGTAYESFKYIKRNGEVQWVDLIDQADIYEESICKITEKTEFDIIHAHDWLTFKAALKAKELSGRPLILHVHSVEADRAGNAHGGNPIVREIESMAMHAADKVIAVSQHTKNCIAREYNIPKDKIEVVHNSINAYEVTLSEYNTYKYLEELKNKGYKVVVNIGRLTVQKNLVNLLRAAQQVVLRNPKTVFLLVGSGEQYRELLSLSAELGIAKNVIFTGFLRGKQWRDAYVIGDLFVMPSVSEPFGLTPLESIAHGTPTLISKQSGVSEVLKNCLKVDYWDVDEMANLITSALSSDALLSELHNQSKQEYERLSWDDSTNKLINLYNNHLVGART